MSPEQARGRVVDKRTDIWAFGCVLFEMLTGTAPFGGATVTDTLAAIIGRDPDWTKLPSSTPAGIQKLMRRCLEKETKRRLRDMGDVSIEIGDALNEHQNPVSAAPRGPTRAGVRLSSWLFGSLALILVIAAAGWRFSSLSTSSAHQRVSFVIPPPPGVKWGLLPIEPSPVASPDGRQIAFVSGSSPGTRSVWIHSIDSGVAHQLTGIQDAVNDALFWSPDSTTLAYCAAGQLKTIEVSGVGRSQRSVGCR